MSDQTTHSSWKWVISSRTHGFFSWKTSWQPISLMLKVMELNQF